MHTYCDDRGRSLMSVFDHVSEIAGQLNVSLMYPGVVKAWHRHARQEDYWAVLSGGLKIGLFNTESSPLTAELRLVTGTPGEEQFRMIDVAPNGGAAVYLGEHRPGTLRIPVGLWHGAVAVGGQNALLLYYVTRKYDPADPDEQRAAWDAFDFSWQIEFK